MQAPAVDEGSALLSMDEQEEAFIDTSTSNGNSPGGLTILAGGFCATSSSRSGMLLPVWSVQAFIVDDRKPQHRTLSMSCSDKATADTIQA